MDIILLQGPSGSGKSTIIKRLCKLGKKTLEEKYYESIHHLMSRQGLVSKFCWIGYWFKSLYTNIESNPDQIFTDRSPYESAIYAQNGHKIIDAIRTAMEEISLEYEVNWINVYLYAPFEI